MDKKRSAKGETKDREVHALCGKLPQAVHLCEIEDKKTPAAHAKSRKTPDRE